MADITITDTGVLLTVWYTNSQCWSSSTQTILQQAAIGLT